MKLKFKSQEFQSDAVNAVADLFLGQERMQNSFGIEMESATTVLETEFGIGNKLSLEQSAIEANMHSIQKRQNLPQTNGEQMQFSIEMETGTGKTYVYTKSIFELNKRYGFTKFIIVVPSVAIREGVCKSLQVTADHFANHYDNVPNRHFIYNSSRLSDVRQFATSANIEIMIINIDAFKKAENIINQAQDRLNGETAMEYIRATNPVVIIDEPQSVDNTDKAKEAIASLNPMCVLRYSATHKEKINLLYRLTPVDAYNMGLVKQICVSSNQTVNDFNKPYIRLVSVSNSGGFSAKLELDVQDKQGKVLRKIVQVKPNTELFVATGERELYNGYTVSGIDCSQGFESVEFSNGEMVQMGSPIGDIDENIIKRMQIRRTIEAHLSKELRYFKMGIKVLSLFFIDEVKKYRNDDGGKGLYAEMFEECYNELLAMQKYAPIKDMFETDVARAHDGYFSQDKKGKFKNTNGTTNADDDTYNLIMKKKEELLSFESPLRFIFSHSALREGWDNPNVFQVCTLIEQKSTFTVRQKVGRGLRLCVNQDGDRIEDKEINILHVMANESFAEFAETLQKEIENETGVKFGYIDIALFSGMVYEDKQEVERVVTTQQAEAVVELIKSVEPSQIESVVVPKELELIKAEVVKMAEKAEPIAVEKIEGIAYTETKIVEKTISYDESVEIIKHFEDKGYIDKKGKIKDTMKVALNAGKIDLPEKFEAARSRFESVVVAADNRPPIRDASRDVIVRIKKQAILSPEFIELWNKIKHKTTYRVSVDTPKLVDGAVKGISQMEKIPKARIVSQSADININHSGVSYSENGYRYEELEESYTLPNVVGVISERCLITRRTAVEILNKSERIEEFLNNPQLFVERVVDVINHERHKLAIDGIKYIKLDGEEYSVMEIFNQDEIIANLDRNAVAVDNSLYDHVIYDSSSIEKPFAVALDEDPNVKMFFKIPDRFKIDTPIGTYNPDWAVYIDSNGEKKLYFVIETKGVEDLFGVRPTEALKIHCGKRHFSALEDNIELKSGKRWDKMRSEI
ncbi:MAG: DEAD/DEAH box helicase family protein [Rikenellaceae bacterium]